MWIRSQDKEMLIEVKSLKIVNRLCDSKGIVGEEYHVYEDGLYNLGCYSTKEKALEVLDMIQKHLTGFLVSGCSRIVHDCPIAGIEFHCVFEMPQDEEV
jgi:hypothetical protein